MRKTTKLMKGIKDKLDKWRNIPYSWSRRFNIIKKVSLPNSLFGFNALSIIIPAMCFVDIVAIDKLI
jgi:hypothetical protein